MEFEQGRWPDIPGNEFLLNDGGNMLFQPHHVGPAYGIDKPVKWGEAERSSMAEILAWVNYWTSQGKDVFAAHLGTGSILWFDFDDRPSRTDANYGHGQTVETAQQAYDGLLSDCLESTYVEQSRTPGRFHAAFRLPSDHGLPLRQIKGMHGIDLLIGNGWVRLTGVSNGKPIADIPANLLKQLQDNVSSYDFDTVPHSEVLNDPDLCALPLDEAVAETLRRMICSTSRTKEGFTYKQLLEGPAGLDAENLSESRAALIQWAAKITCGHREQHEIVWRIVSRSYLAERTPFLSKQNKGRFTQPAKINYDRFNRKGEYCKLIGLANAEVEREKGEVAAQQERMASVAVARRDKKIADRGYWTSVPLGDFPVAAYRDYRDYLRASTSKSNARIIEAATLAHMAHVLGKTIVGPTGTFAAIFIIVPAPAGGGKDTASYEALQRLAPQATHSLGSPGSGGGFHQALLEPACNGVGIAIIDEYQDFLGGKGDSPHVRSSVTTLKSVYGKMQAGKELPATKLVSGNRPAVPEPAVTLLATGIEDGILEAFARTSLTDGYLARHLFPDMTRDLGRFRNRKPDREPAPELRQLFEERLGSLPSLAIGALGRLQPEPIEFASDELADEAHAWIEEIDDLREETHVGTIFAELLRAAGENALRLATGMGAWSPERRITRAIWEWCKGYVINSVAYLLGQHEAGALDAGTPALAQKIMKAMEQFFDGRGSQHHSQQEMRAQGRFRLGSLPNFRRIDEQAKKVNGADPMRPLAAAVEMLKLRDVVEVFKDDRDFTKRIYCKGRAYDEGSE